MQKVWLSLFFIGFYGYVFAQSTAGKGNEAIDSAVVLKPSFNIYPNPARNKIALNVKNFESGTVQVSIFDTKGNRLRKDDRLLVNGTEEVLVYLMLPPGMYFILLKQHDKLVKRKLIIERN